MVINDYENFKQQILQLTTIDLNAYKERQMKRRIDSLIRKNNYDDYNSYVAALKKDKVLFEEFINYLTINVSEFFRNPEQWNLLEKEVLPYLHGKFGKKLKIWSAACSTGDEPYSLVMMLSRSFPLSQISVLATDIDRQVLDKARVGLYNEKSLAEVPKDLRDKYFKQITSTTYQISDEIKKCVEFKQHNLLKDTYPDQCDLIICRNVLIYFTEDAKMQIYKSFNRALKQDGILFVGSTEQIIQPNQLKFSTLKSFFYKKDDRV